MAIEPIRVWLEPGYDGGRVGAWMLDFPGCFVSGRDRDVALARVPSAVGAFAAWLEGHGERIAVPETDERTIVEEVHATVVDGYERNTTFGADKRPVSREELDETLRRFEWAHEDVLAVAARVRAWETEHGPVPASAEREERTALEVLRHLAGAEIWLAGRLDPGARYEGPPRDGELNAFMAAAHDWAVGEVRRLAAADPGMEATDRKGETWTLVKVLRRLVYHALDHFGELDRRLARASGAAETPAIRRDVLIDPGQLDGLFRSVGWYRLVREPGRLARLIEGSTQIVSAWEGSKLVAFARSISDDAAYGLISTVAVHPRWQGKGLGRRVMLALLENNDGIRFSLSAVAGAEGLYASLGFVPDRVAMVRRRRY